MARTIIHLKLCLSNPGSSTTFPKESYDKS